jgi:hypothetical protein
MQGDTLMLSFLNTPRSCLVQLVLLFVFVVCLVLAAKLLYHLLVCGAVAFLLVGIGQVLGGKR